MASNYDTEEDQHNGVLDYRDKVGYYKEKYGNSAFTAEPVYTPDHQTGAGLAESGLKSLATTLLTQAAFSLTGNDNETSHDRTYNQRQALAAGLKSFGQDADRSFRRQQFTDLVDEGIDPSAINQYVLDGNYKHLAASEARNNGGRGNDFKQAYKPAEVVKAYLTNTQLEKGQFNGSSILNGGEGTYSRAFNANDGSLGDWILQDPKDLIDPKVAKPFKTEGITEAYLDKGQTDTPFQGSAVRGDKEGKYSRSYNPNTGEYGDWLFQGRHKNSEQETNDGTVASALREQFELTLKLDQLKDHPGKETAMGFLRGNVPAAVLAADPEAREFISIFDEIKSLAFKAERQSFGTMGAINVKELQMIQQALGSLNRELSPEALDRKIDEILNRYSAMSDHSYGKLSEQQAKDLETYKTTRRESNKKLIESYGNTGNTNEVSEEEQQQRKVVVGLAQELNTTPELALQLINEYPNADDFKLGNDGSTYYVEDGKTYKVD